MTVIQQVKGFRAAGIHCGLKSNKKRDVALIASDAPCTVAGVFTTNRVKAAPVLYDMFVISSGKPVYAVVANAGNANACTGDRGYANACAMAEHTAELLGCDPNKVLVLSTGVIGVQLPMGVIRPGIEAAAGALSPDAWLDAAHAIMTTDTRPKVSSVRADAGYSITGIAKGAGMIAPNMATMMSVIVTDAVIPQDRIGNILRTCVGNSFNRIVVDGDMSTNDTVLFLANGVSGVHAADDKNFAENLRGVCVELAKAIVRDGEGATKLVSIMVNGAARDEDARAVARAIATSPLCKTAFYGADPNWGRIVCAAGYSGVELDPDNMVILMDDGQKSIKLFENGQQADYDEAEAIALMKKDEWAVYIGLGMGDCTDMIWTCDLGHEYITINSHYRT